MHKKYRKHLNTYASTNLPKFQILPPITRLHKQYCQQKKKVGYTHDYKQNYIIIAVYLPPHIFTILVYLFFCFLSKLSTLSDFSKSMPRCMVGGSTSTSPRFSFFQYRPFCIFRDTSYADIRMLSATMNASEALSRHSNPRALRPLKTRT